MICQSCGQNEASVLVQTVVNNFLQKTALCASCASELEPENALDALMEVLSGLSPRARAQHGRCPECRTSFADFRETGRFGCPRCYEQFQPQIRDLLPRVHAGAYQHRGKTPGRR